MARTRFRVKIPVIGSMRHKDRHIRAINQAHSMIVRVTSNTFLCNELRPVCSTTAGECSPTATWSSSASASLAPSPMRRVSVLGLLCVFNGMCSTDIYASDSADVLRGKQLARIACSDCHVVASDSESPPLRYAPAPRFDDIASRPGTSEKSLQKFHHDYPLGWRDGAYDDAEARPDKAAGRGSFTVHHELAQALSASLLPGSNNFARSQRRESRQFVGWPWRRRPARGELTTNVTAPGIPGRPITR